MADRTKVRALIPTGLGFNCEKESAAAFELAGATSTICDIRDLIAGKHDLFDHDCLMIIGGFSYGDDLGSGKAVANLLKYSMLTTSQGKMRFLDAISRFVDQEKVVLGICNGFQVLLKLGILPGDIPNTVNTDNEQTATLTLNDSGRFENRWVQLGMNPGSPCIATRSLNSVLSLPVRHGEGKFIAASGVMDSLIKNDLQFCQYLSDGEPTTRYPQNPNGSPHGIAGISDRTGRIIGMMPHPEANLLFENHPEWTRLRRSLRDAGRPVPRYGEGLKIFSNIVRYLEDTR